MRAFIAVDLDPSLKASVLELLRKLEATGADVRWARPDGCHLTLKFLGEIDDEAVGRVEAALASSARRQPAFALRIEGAGAFPSERAPRVLWLGVVADPGLGVLQADLEGELESLGFAREDRPFKPHLTLGRVKGRVRLERAMAELDKARRSEFGGMTVRKVALFESLLRPQGAEYRVVHEAQLG